MIAEPQSRTIAVIADDEDLGRLLLAEACCRAGLTPLAFDNGRDALVAAREPGVAIVLLDVDMPGLDGFSVCRELRAEPHLTTLPIVMVTGHDDGAAIDGAFAAGATDFVTKPVNWALLPHRLGYILRNAAATQTLADREAKVHTLLEAVPDALWLVAPDGEVRWHPHTYGSNSNCEAVAGDAIAPPNLMPEVLRHVRSTALDGVPRKLECRQQDDAGVTHSCEMRFVRSDVDAVLVVRQDTGERTRAAERIERLAYFDTLTGLPNRQRCIETAERMLADAGADESVAAVYLDLNGFKRINDSFGHTAGDGVLRTIANRLHDVVTRVDGGDGRVALARFGSDDFVMLVRDADARLVGLRLADACQEELSKSVTHDGIEFFATPSIGVAVYPEHATDVETLLKNADTAMHQAKTGGAWLTSLYTPAMNSRLRDWLDLEARLRRAVREDRLALAYQPKFRLNDDSLAGVEALVRWHDPEHGDVPPSNFIGMAEESGLIIEIGEWVIRNACRQLRRWLDAGFGTSVAINVSGKELLHGDPAGVLEVALAEFGVPGHLVEIEITESVLVKDSAAVRRTLERFRRLGCRIALDDFGTGYSSLAYITRFPPDRIKIDRAFVRNVDQSSSDGAIASAILSLANSLGIEVTAEGIERPGQLQWLRSRGCHQAQGFLLSVPLPAHELEQRFLRGEPPSSRVLPSGAVA